MGAAIVVGGHVGQSGQITTNSQKTVLFGCQSIVELFNKNQVPGYRTVDYFVTRYLYNSKEDVTNYSLRDVDVNKCFQQLLMF